MKKKSLMFQGTASSVGKSVITAGIGRVLSQDGYNVAPFKSQNMALNSYITSDGFEMGRAQVVQAKACNKNADIRMNPILLKPTTDKETQVIIEGKVYKNMNAVDYFAYKPALKNRITEIYNDLESENDYVLIEGAGSPAEINLRENDIVNMGMAEIADSPVVLIADIDKGGVFAFIVGTIQLLREEEKKRVKGIIINKFRGDLTILQPGIKMLEDIIHIPVIGVIPYFNIDIEEEDSVTDRLPKISNKNAIVDIAVIRLPHISNFTDFNALSLEKGVTVRYIKHVDEIGNPDIVIIPGSKNTIEDLIAIKHNKIADRIIALEKEGKIIIGICGGYQMLGKKLFDEKHVESHISAVDGLGLLDMEVVFKDEKVTSQVLAKVCSDTNGVLKNVANAIVKGYEIHMGENIFGENINPCTYLAKRNRGDCHIIDGVANKKGNVFGTYIHGIFDNGSFLRGIINYIREEKGIECNTDEILSYDEYVDMEFDRLANILRYNIDMDYLYKIINDEV